MATKTGQASATSKQVETFPLGYRTPTEWAEQVLRNPLSLLNDHAHLEKKAATNALELLTRWPAPAPPQNWTATMTSIARDEAEHLALVVRLLGKRNGQLTRTHRNPYAADLRNLVRLGTGVDELMDRLMVSALIELRSCERFLLLADHGTDRELTALYRGLHASEAGHYRVFLEQARQLTNPATAKRRWREMLAAEAEIIARQKPGPRIHSGVKTLPPA